MAAKWCPNRTQREVGTKSRPFASRSAGGGPAIVDAEYPNGEKAAVESVGEEIGTDSRQHHPGRVDGLASVQCEDSPSHGSRKGDHQPT